MFTACQKPSKQELKFYYESDYFDLEIDTMQFTTYLNLTPIDTELWVKLHDTIREGQYRWIKYNVSNKDSVYQREYFVKDNGVLQTLAPNRQFLTVYKPYLMEKKDTGIYHYERKGGVVRQFYSKYIQQNLTPFYNGSTILSIVEDWNDLNDSTTTIRQNWEYYGLRKGPVKLKEEFKKYVRGTKTEDYSILKLRTK